MRGGRSNTEPNLHRRILPLPFCQTSSSSCPLSLSVSFGFSVSFPLFPALLLFLYYLHAFFYLSLFFFFTGLTSLFFLWCILCLSCFSNIVSPRSLLSPCLAATCCTTIRSSQRPHSPRSSGRTARGRRLPGIGRADTDTHRRTRREMQRYKHADFKAERRKVGA